jgi:hypothetical protein
MIFLIYLLLTIGVGWIGSKRDIGAGWSIALSLALSPVIGILIVLFSKKTGAIKIIEDE